MQATMGTPRKGYVNMLIYVPAKVHRALKSAAAARGMSLSEYALARILAPGPVMVGSGDIVAAPQEDEGVKRDPL